MARIVIRIERTLFRPFGLISENIHSRTVKVDFFNLFHTILLTGSVYTPRAIAAEVLDLDLIIEITQFQQVVCGAIDEVSLVSIYEERPCVTTSNTTFHCITKFADRGFVSAEESSPAVRLINTQEHVIRRTNEEIFESWNFSIQNLMVGN